MHRPPRTAAIAASMAIKETYHAEDIDVCQRIAEREQQHVHAGAYTLKGLKTARTADMINVQTSLLTRHKANVRGKTHTATRTSSRLRVLHGTTHGVDEKHALFDKAVTAAVGKRVVNEVLSEALRAELPAAEPAAVMHLPSQERKRGGEKRSLSATTHDIEGRSTTLSARSSSERGAVDDSNAHTSGTRADTGRDSTSETVDYTAYEFDDSDTDGVDGDVDGNDDDSAVAARLHARRARRRLDEDYDDDFVPGGLRKSTALGARDRIGYGCGTGDTTRMHDDIARLKTAAAAARCVAGKRRVQSATLAVLEAQTTYMYRGGGCGAAPHQLMPLDGADDDWDIRTCKPIRRAGTYNVRGVCSICTCDSDTVWILCLKGHAMCKECACRYLDKCLSEHHMRGAGLMQCPWIDGGTVNCLAYEHAADMIVDLACWLGLDNSTVQQLLTSVRTGDHDVFRLQYPGARRWTCNGCGVAVMASFVANAQACVARPPYHGGDARRGGCMDQHVPGWGGGTPAIGDDMARGTQPVLVDKGSLECGVCHARTCVTCGTVAPKDACKRRRGAVSTRNNRVLLRMAACDSAIGLTWHMADTGCAHAVTVHGAGDTCEAEPIIGITVPLQIGPALPMAAFYARCDVASWEHMKAWQARAQLSCVERFTASEKRFLIWACRLITRNIHSDPLAASIHCHAGMRSVVVHDLGCTSATSDGGDTNADLLAYGGALTTVLQGFANDTRSNDDVITSAPRVDLTPFEVYDSLETDDDILMLTSETRAMLETLYLGGMRQLCPICARPGVKNKKCCTITCCNMKWCYLCAKVRAEGIATAEGAERMVTTTGYLTTVPPVHGCPHLLERADMADTEEGPGLVTNKRATELFHVARHAVYVYAMMLACGPAAAIVPTLLLHDEQWLVWWRRYCAVPFMFIPELRKWRVTTLKNGCMPTASKRQRVLARVLAGSL